MILWDAGYTSITVGTHTISIQNYKSCIAKSFQSLIKLVDSCVLLNVKFPDGVFNLRSMQQWLSMTTTTQTQVVMAYS